MPMPDGEPISRDAVFAARDAVDAAKAAYLRGYATYDVFQKAAEEYKRIAETRQVQIWGKVRLVVNVKTVMR